MSKIVNKAIKQSSFGKVDLDPKTPDLKPVAPAPDPETKAVAESRRRQRGRRTGRTSTVLATGGSSKLG